MRNALMVLTGITMICACSSPIGPIAGGALEGTQHPWPADWRFTNDVPDVLLQTNPAKPYSVTLWMVVDNNQPYVAAASADARWVRNLRADPQVILSVEGKLYPGTITRVTERDEIERVIAAYLVKYEIDSREDFVQEGGQLFRLAPP